MVTMHMGDKMNGIMRKEMARPRGRPSKAGQDCAGPLRTIGIRSTAEWSEWVERAAKFCRTDSSQLIVAALVDYLRAKSFVEPAPPRL
jgi:hypothetical protein